MASAQPNIGPSEVRGTSGANLGRPLFYVISTNTKMGEMHEPSPGVTRSTSTEPCTRTEMRKMHEIHVGRSADLQCQNAHNSSIMSSILLLFVCT